MKSKLLLMVAYFFINFFTIPSVVFSSNLQENTVPLIPRNVLFANPEKAAPELNSDGSKIAYLAPIKRVLNIWVANTNDFAHAKPITFETKRSLRGFSWTYNKDYIVYGQDQNGDENFHLYRVNVHTKKVRDLTPFPKIHAIIIKMSRNFPNELLVGLNNRNAEWHDIYRLNLRTGKLQLLEENNRFSGFVADEQFNLRIAEKPTAENAADYYFKDSKSAWKFYERIPFEDALTSGYEGFNKDGSIVYLNDSRGRDTAAFFSLNMQTQKKTLIAADNKSDIGGVLFHPTELKPQAYATEYEKVNWYILDKNIADDFAYLKQAVAQDFSVVDRSLTDDKWLIRYYSDTKPSKYYLYERDPKANKPVKLTFLFATLPQYEKLPFVAQRPVIIKSRDGLNLVSYLTLPATVANKNGVPIHPVPMILDVHGGPWARDDWGLSRDHQWLANRGYAVLSVNYRGSTGFGKKFVNAGNLEWGGKMHQDLIDAVNWAIDNKIADPKKIAIMGGSYGGYAALVGMTFTPEVFCCGVSIVGISNLLTFVKTIPPYWKPDIALLKKRVGDFDTKEGCEFLKSRSPLTYANRIVKPLLILQGEHDPRVNKAEAEQIVNSMKQKNIPVTYVLYHNEGHGFAGEANQISSNAIIELFLAENLGGRYEPIKTDFNGANFSIVEGGKYVKGLKK